jgi:hypothetical protein
MRRILRLQACNIPVSEVSMVTGYELDYKEIGVRVSVEFRMFSPEPFWGPLSLLFNAYRTLFHRG